MSAILSSKCEYYFFVVGNITLKFFRLPDEYWWSFIDRIFGKESEVEVLFDESEGFQYNVVGRHYKCREVTKEEYHARSVGG